MHDAAIHSLLHDRYSAAHGATPVADYPTYLTIGAPNAPQAVLGFRCAGARPLFLERYVSGPIEEVLSERFGRPIARHRIAELGDHASRRPAATIALWREAAAALEGQADVAVAVLTRPMRAMFNRVGLALHMLAPARIEAMGDAAAQWGTYYENDPVLCVGDISECRQQLEITIKAKHA